MITKVSVGFWGWRLYSVSVEYDHTSCIDAFFFPPSFTEWPLSGTTFVAGLLVGCLLLGVNRTQAIRASVICGTAGIMGMVFAQLQRLLSLDAAAPYAFIMIFCSPFLVGVSVAPTMALCGRKWKRVVPAYPLVILAATYCMTAAQGYGWSVNGLWTQYQIWP